MTHSCVVTWNKKAQARDELRERNKKKSIERKKIVQSFIKVTIMSICVESNEK